ncbi:LexA family transcriptional regulator [Novosphingobium sp. M1R2S20]|uniref:Helix-turn-helix transcriptional regulator n=1 Tax=Novosphingobium rhizovicinum TaxID=3228928 RepID=A0ABV3RCU3_9SPHN
MSESGDRLQLALKEAGLSLREAADRFGWSYNTLKSNANGNMPFSFKKAMVYAGRLKVRAEWLYSGTPPMREPDKPHRKTAKEIPVIGWVQAGALADATAIHDTPDQASVVVDGLGPGEWFATDVQGDSMDRVSPEGSRIFVNADDRDLIPGAFYLFSLRGETTYKRYYDDPVARLEPYSTNPANRPIFLAPDRDWTVVGRVYRSVIDLG